MKNLFKNGDTLIEVLLAISIFSFVMMGGLMLMNKGMAIAQSTLEATMARNAIDAQAESLRLINAAYLADPSNGQNSSYVAKRWNGGGTGVASHSKNSASNIDKVCNPSDSNTRVDNAFAIDPINLKNISIKGATTYPRINYDGRDKKGDIDTNDISNKNKGAESLGVWVEAVKPGNGSHYIDFHVRACWTAPGNNTTTRLGTIVRLYDNK